jgi:hypothetical protein
MKEWANKPSSMVTTGSSPLKTTSATTPLTSRLRMRDLSCLTQTSSSPLSSVQPTSGSIVKTSSSIVKTSGSVVRTSGSSMTLTSGSSRTLLSTSSGSVGTNLSQRAAVGAATVAPLAAGTVVGGIAAVFYGISNMIKYGEHKKTGAQAAKDTVKDSAGLGISTGLGVAAAHAVAGTALAFGSAVIVPIGAGFATGCISMKIWNKIFSGGKETSKNKKKAQ